MQVALDVLDGDDRVVDQDADRQREAAERHQVERLAEHVQRQDRRQDRQRDGERDDQRAAPVAEEQQHHRGGQAGGDQRLLDHARDGRPARRPTGRTAACTLMSGGSSLCRARQRRLEIVDDVERRGAAVLQHRQQHAARAVVAHDVGLRREAVAHLGDVAQIGDGAVHRAHRQVVQARDGVGEPFMPTVYSVGADLRRARGQDQVLRVDRVDDVDRREALGLQRRVVEVDRDEALLAAVRERDWRRREW